MDHDLELSELMQHIASKSLQWFSNLSQQPQTFPMLVERGVRFAEDYQFFLTALFKNPEQLWHMLLAYWSDANSLMQAQMQYWQEGKSMPIEDKRFSHEAWVNNPFFNVLSQQYVLASEHMNSLVAHMDYGDKTLAKRIQFFTRQYLDAISPDNFLQTNPQLMAETLQSHGKNLLKGLHNLLNDMDSDSSRLILKMTDMDAFKVGLNLAITPGHVIFQNDLIELIQYTPQTTQTYAVPLLIIPPWINKYYILDLSPGNSLIAWLVSQGITVFTISWKNPTGGFAHKGLCHYLNEGPISAIEVIQKQLHVKKVNTLGFCIGGTLLAMLLAYYQEKKIKSIQSATLLASLIDFSDPGDIGVFIDEKQVKMLEEQMSKKGYLEGHFMGSAFNSLRASDLIWSFFIKNYLQGKPPVPFDILYWNADTTNMPAKMHSEYLRWMYLKNNLIKPNKIVLNGVRLNMNNVSVPTFFVGTKKDHIAPWKTVYAGFQCLKGKKTFLLGGSGHIGGIIIPPGTEKYGYYRNDDYSSQAEQWLENAKYASGSWWPVWLTWLKKQSGRKMTAPIQNELPYSPLMDAPGSYVFEKSF